MSGSLQQDWCSSATSLALVLEIEMQELELHEIELVSGGDAAATRIAGTNSWGEIINRKYFDGAQCKAAGTWSIPCFDYALKYSSW